MSAYSDHTIAPAIHPRTVRANRRAECTNERPIDRRRQSSIPPSARHPIVPESDAHRRWRRCRRTSRRQRSARPTLAGRQCGVRGRGGRCLVSSKDAPAIAPVDSARWRNASRPGLIARPRRSHPVRLLPNRVATKTRTQPDSWRIRAALASHPTHRRPVHVTPGARRSHGDGFAPKTVHEVHVIIRSALNDAIDCGLLRNNAAAKARSPRPHDRRRTGTSAWDVSSRGDRSGCGSGHDRSPRAVTTKAASTAARSSASATTSPSWPTRARTARVKSSGAEDRRSRMVGVGTFGVPIGSPTMGGVR